MTNNEMKWMCKSMTWFERIKACQTPEEMAEMLDDEKETIFCPSCGCCPAGGDYEQTLCHDCITDWLRREA